MAGQHLSPRRFVTPSSNPEVATPGGWRLSLVIPAYNEAAGIGQAVAEADDALRDLAADYEIIVVDDGSTDGTAMAVAQAARDRPRARLVRHEVNRGYGAALRTGFETARFDRVAFTDADCQFDLADLAFMVPLANEVSLVVGRRVNRQDPWHRRFFSWGYNVLVRTLLGTRVRDCDCALKVFRKNVVERLLPESTGFFVNTEMLTRARQLGCELAEVEVRHRPRLRGHSKVSLGDIPRTLGTLLPFWWARVLFPGGRPPTTDTARGPWLDYGWLLVMVVAGLLFFSRLGCPLQEPEEPRYAEIPRQMLAEDRLLRPVLHGQPYYDKPPLLYWMVMGSYQLFGVHDWSARLVASGVGFLIVLVSYWWGKQTAGPRAALVGALILCLSARFVYLGRLLTMNSLLCLCAIAALAAAHVAMSSGTLRWRWWLASAAACGLGLLAKGPVALALVVVPVAAIQFLNPRTARIGWRGWCTYVALACALAAPWFIAVAATDPSFGDYFFWKHNVQRFVAPFDHEAPPWFYLPSLFLGMLPWTLLLVPLAGFLRHKSGRASLRRPAALGFFLLAALWSLLFFSASGCKRAGYILPAMPPLALALGCYLDAVLPRERWHQVGAHLLCRRSALAFHSTVLVLGLGTGGAVVAVAAGVEKAAIGLAMAAAAGAALAALTWWEWRRLAVSWAICGTATFAILLAGTCAFLPGYARRFSMRGQVRPLAELTHDRNVPVVCYPRMWDSVSFYLQRNDVRVRTADHRAALLAELGNQPETLIFVKSGRPHQDLLSALPPSLEFVPQGRQGNVRVGLIRRRSELAAELGRRVPLPGSTQRANSAAQEYAAQTDDRQ